MMFVTIIVLVTIQRKCMHSVYIPACKHCLQGYTCTICLALYTAIIIEYSGTCLKQPPLGQKLLAALGRWSYYAGSTECKRVI